MTTLNVEFKLMLITICYDSKKQTIFNLKTYIFFYICRLWFWKPTKRYIDVNSFKKKVGRRTNEFQINIYPM